MTSKHVKQNMKELIRQANNKKNRLTPTIRPKVIEIINLYKRRKISQFTTAEKFVNRLTSDDTKTRDKAIKDFNKKYDELNARAPLSKRMAQARKKGFRITYYLYRFPMEAEKMSIAFEDDYGYEYVSMHSQPIQADVNMKQDHIPSRVIGNFLCKEREEANKKENKRKRYTKKTKRSINIHDSKLWKAVYDILETDKDFASLPPEYKAYIQAFKILSIDEIPEKAGGAKTSILEEELTDTRKVSTYSRYIELELKDDVSTFKEGLDEKLKHENECWIDALVNYYGDTLMSENRKERLRLTREKVISIIGKTEEEFHLNGASVNDMAKVFDEFNLPVRIYDNFNHLIYKRDATSRHNKCFYAMVKNNHIYVLNNNLCSLSKFHNINGGQWMVKASTDFYIGKDKEAPVCKIIDNIDDLLTLNESENYKIIHARNNLASLFNDFVNAGYEPSIRWTAGYISDLFIRVNKINYHITTQNLVPDSLDGGICVENEVVFNKLSGAMLKFKNDVFKPCHKSYYNEYDMPLFENCRTIVPSGKLYNMGKLYNQRGISMSDMVELDVRKAFTKAFTDINRVPVFSQFDEWKPYRGEGIKNLTLYMVKVDKVSLFFQRTHCLVYGKFLKHLMETDTITIIYYKQPSFTYKTDYKKTIDDLWSTDLETQLKKTTANVVFGLMEKGRQTAQKSQVFSSLKEALNYQNEYGGKISILHEVAYDEDDEEYYVPKYYILTVSDTAVLKNGFKFIKELLLQNHNFKILMDYRKLRANKVEGFSVKTDAFAILSKELEKAKTILNFGDEIGDWRHSKNDFMYPEGNIYLKKNDLIKISERVNETLEVVDEYDTPTIVEQIKEKRVVMIRGLYAGSGKSYIPEWMAQNGYRVLFVIGTNNLTQEVSGEAITVNKFFSINFGEEKLQPFDYSEYDVIVFDEIYFNDTYKLYRIKEFIKNNPDKIIIGAGDVCQLEPVADTTNTKDHEEYMNDCIDQMFKYNIWLKICKRLKSEEDRVKLGSIRRDLLETDKPIKEIVEGYFRYTDKIEMCENNIAYTNETCRKVASEIRRMKQLGEDCIIGDRVICKK